MAMTHLTEQEAFEHEKFLILCFKDMGTSLCNQTDGGEGVSGLVCSAETRAKIGLAIKGNSHTPEVRARISAKLSVLQMGNTRGKGHDVGEKVMAMMTGNKLFAGHKHTDEWRAKRSAFRHSDETKAKMSAARMGNQNARKHKTELNETP